MSFSGYIFHPSYNCGGDTERDQRREGRGVGDSTSCDNVVLPTGFAAEYLSDHRTFALAVARADGHKRAYESPKNTVVVVD